MQMNNRVGLDRRELFRGWSNGMFGVKRLPRQGFVLPK